MYNNVLEYLEGTLIQYGNKKAFDDLEQSISFLELVNIAKKIGSAISDKITTKSPIVVYMEKNIKSICSFLGAVYAGGFYVPIDAEMPVERVKLILDTLQPKLIIYDEKSENKIAMLGGYNCAKYSEMIEYDINEERLCQIRAKSKNTDILYVLFTSGSTGIPKGVTISHGAVIDFVEWICNKYKMDSDVTMCNQAPFYFDASVPDIYIPLKTGATVYIPPKSYYTFPKKILSFIEENEINTLVWVPSALCTVVNCKALDILAPKSIRLVIFCGEVMPCKHLNVWREHIPNALYVNMYGPTEATYACMYYDVDRVFGDEEKLPLGKACENSEILLITEENRRADVNEVGEICILGQCLSSGYYGAKEKTEAVFVQNPLNNNWMELMYRTGDLAYESSDGEIVFSGRKDFQIKRLGHRIELGEIENVILAMNDIECVCCVYNEDTSNITAIYVGNIEEEELEMLLNSKIPGYMRPNKIIKIDKMPMNINGKIDRPLLKARFA